MIEKIYTVKATTVGGRNGHVKSETGKIDMQMNMPKVLGGSEIGTNPEELFACGYSSCFDGALNMVAKNQGLKIAPSTTTAHVSFCKNSEDGGFCLSVSIETHIPDMDLIEAQKLVDAAHQVCPYSKATRNNIEVDVKAV